MESCFATSALFVGFLAFFFRALNGEFRLRRMLNLPPSPKPWPIIGNLDLIGHQSIPLKQLRFRSFPIVVSSAVDMAKQILKTQDLNFAFRPKTKALCGMKISTFFLFFLILFSGTIEAARPLEGERSSFQKAPITPSAANPCSNSFPGNGDCPHQAQRPREPIEDMTRPREGERSPFQSFQKAPVPPATASPCSNSSPGSGDCPHQAQRPREPIEDMRRPREGERSPFQSLQKAPVPPATTSPCSNSSPGSGDCPHQIQRPRPPMHLR